MPEPPMTSAEARAYLKISRSTLDRECEKYRHTNGRQGLRHEQRGANSHRRFRRADLDRWSAGDIPARLRAAS